MRVRVVLVVIFLGASLLPPYVSTLANTTDDQEVPAQQFLFVEEGFLMKSGAIGRQGSRLAYSEGLMHQVRDGESIEKIAAQYGVNTDTIRWANGLGDHDTLKPGQELLILPVNGVMHVVRRGQTLARIAQVYDVPIDAIVRQNKIKGGFIVAGEQLIIPGGKPIAGSSVVAAVDQNLRFADTLPSKDIRLPFGSTATADQGIAPSAGAVLSQTLLQMPCENCFYTQKYHPGHYAVDIQERGGGPVFAAEAGTVIRADVGWDGGYGNVIEIDHGNGLVTLYGHNKKLLVKKGDTVKRGQQISLMGNTGLVHGPTGIHVHFEVRVNGVKRNPELYLE